MKHVSVLKDELIDFLQIKEGDIVVDGTLGGGGHTEEIIKRFGKMVKIIGFDVDEDSVNLVKEKIKDKECNVELINANFVEIADQLLSIGIERVDKIFFDLGISSFQLDDSSRGFSFLRNEPLLMTMKKNLSKDDLTACEIVNSWSEETIADIIYGFGDEKYSRKIARAIVEYRKKKRIETTFDLVEIINQSCGHHYRHLKIHPATRTFQALRIAVNAEVVNLEKAIKSSFEILSEGGRMAIISFHSLEDRIVKKSFQDFRKIGLGNILTKKPKLPTQEEIKTNPRSRSAKLRVIEKLLV